MPNRRAISTTAALASRTLRSTAAGIVSCRCFPGQRPKNLLLRIENHHAMLFARYGVVAGDTYVHGRRSPDEIFLGVQAEIAPAIRPFQAHQPSHYGIGLARCKILPYAASRARFR